MYLGDFLRVRGELRSRQGAAGAVSAAGAWRGGGGGGAARARSSATGGGTGSPTLRFLLIWAAMVEGTVCGQQPLLLRRRQVLAGGGSGERGAGRSSGGGQSGSRLAGERVGAGGGNLPPSRPTAGPTLEASRLRFIVIAAQYHQ